MGFHGVSMKDIRMERNVLIVWDVYLELQETGTWTSGRCPVVSVPGNERLSGSSRSTAVINRLDLP